MAAAASKEVALRDAPSDGVSALRFSPAGDHLLASASWDCSVRVHDAVANSLRASFRHKAPVLDVAFVDAGTLVSGGLDREVLMCVPTPRWLSAAASRARLERRLHERVACGCESGRG